MRGGGRSKRCGDALRPHRGWWWASAGGSRSSLRPRPPRPPSARNVAAACGGGAAKRARPVPGGDRRDLGTADPSGRAPPPAPPATGRWTASPDRARATRSGARGRPRLGSFALMADRPSADLGRRRRSSSCSTSAATGRAGSTAGSVRVRVAPWLAFSAPPRSRWTASRDPPHCGRSGTGGRRVSRAGRCASCAPSPERSGTGSTPAPDRSGDGAQEAHRPARDTRRPPVPERPQCGGSRDAVHRERGGALKASHGATRTRTEPAVEPARPVAADVERELERRDVPSALADPHRATAEPRAAAAPERVARARSGDAVHDQSLVVLEAAHAPTGQPS